VDRFGDLPKKELLTLESHGNLTQYSSIKHKPAIATESFIDVFFSISLTTCFDPFGPSSGESQYVIFSHTSPENYRYLNGSVVSNSTNGECTYY
jgi:hypothetical protein